MAGSKAMRQHRVVFYGGALLRFMTRVFLIGAVPHVVAWNSAERGVIESGPAAVSTTADNGASSSVATTWVWPRVVNLVSDSDGGVRSLAVATGGSPDAVESAALECFPIGNMQDCTFGIGFQAGTEDLADVLFYLRCPVSAADVMFDVRLSSGCECTAEVQSTSSGGVTCGCAVCTDGFGSATVSVDCSAETDGNGNPYRIVGECQSLDCYNVCNGGCLENCAVSGADGTDLCDQCEASLEEGGNITATEDGPSADGDAGGDSGGSSDGTGTGGGDSGNGADSDGGGESSTELEFEPWGESSFGSLEGDLYSVAHQRSLRRFGWSWGDPHLEGSAPFCYGSTCYDVTEACVAMGGVVISTSLCSFPDDVKIAGPSCWQGECTAKGKNVCDMVAGITIGVDGVEWCIFRGARSLVGPACYDDECFSDELAEMCTVANGRIWNSIYCFLSGFYTVVGPVCWGESCFAGSMDNACADAGGMAFGGRWCVVSGCDFSVIGPTCSRASQECFPGATDTICSILNGRLFAERFCLVSGIDWSVLGPTTVGTRETSGVTASLCANLTNGLPSDGPFSGLNARNIGGRFCVVKGRRLPMAGPFCTASGCNQTVGGNFCTRFGGESILDTFCVLPGSYRQVIGPAIWNSEVFNVPQTLCEGTFCAIQTTTNSTTRCPIDQTPDPFIELNLTPAPTQSSEPTLVPSAIPTSVPSRSSAPTSRPSQSVGPTGSPAPTALGDETTVELGAFSFVMSPATIDPEMLRLSLERYLTREMKNSFGNLGSVSLISLSANQRRHLQEATADGEFDFSGQAVFNGSPPPASSMINVQQTALQNSAAVEIFLAGADQLGQPVQVLRAAAEGPGPRGTGVITTTASSAIQPNPLTVVTIGVVLCSVLY